MPNTIIGYVLVLILIIGVFMYKINVLNITINEKSTAVNKLTSKLNEKDRVINNLKLDNVMCKNNLDTANTTIDNVNKAAIVALQGYNDKVIKLNKMLKKKPKVIYRKKLYKDANCTMGLELNKGISRMTYEDF